MRSTKPFPACSQIVHHLDRGQIATNSDRIQGKTPATRTLPCSASSQGTGGVGGCWRGQCRGVGCPEPPPGHIAASPRAFCCQKAAAGGFSHSRAPRLNAPQGWGPRWQLAPVSHVDVSFPFAAPTAFLLRRSSWLGRTVLSWPTVFWMDVAFRSHVVGSDSSRSLGPLFAERPRAQPRPLCQGPPCCHRGGLVLVFQLLHPLPAELCT